MSGLRPTVVERVSRVRVEGRQLLNTVEFGTQDALAVEIERKYRSGIMNAEAVGFRPLEFRQRRGGGTEFIRQELLEFSTVAVPANAGALQIGRGVEGNVAGPEGQLTNEDLEGLLRTLEIAHARLRPTPDDRLRQKIWSYEPKSRFLGNGSHGVIGQKRG
jgi:hypothetical protein